MVAWIWAIRSIEILRVCGADESIKPGVERSGTPGGVDSKKPSAREAGDRFRAAARFARFFKRMKSTWGSAALHPRLYACTRFAGWDAFLCR